MPEHASGGHTLRVGADTGGTFTDITFFDPATQKLTVWKVSSTTGDPSSGTGPVHPTRRP